jgi:hypothetical protein
MKKLIDIPDSISKELKKMAIDKGDSIKSIIETFLIDGFKLNKSTELAIEINDDEQIIRALTNYLSSTHNFLNKDLDLSYDSFLKIVKDVCINELTHIEDV